MNENKELYEQFETDDKDDEKVKREEERKSRKRFMKRLKNIGLLIVFFGAIYIIIKRSREIQALQKKIDEEKRKKEEQRKILTDSVIINNNTEDKEMVRKWVNQELTFQTKLLYRLSRDGPSIFNFHSKM